MDAPPKIEEINLSAELAPLHAQIIDLQVMRDRCLALCRERDRLARVVQAWRAFMYAKPPERTARFVAAAKLTEAL